MTIAVYHFSSRIPLEWRAKLMTEFRKESHTLSCQIQFAKGGYDCVALLTTDDLDSAFEQTQHFHEGWNSPECLRSDNKCFSDQPRSSTMGDILIRFDPDRPRIFVVSAIDFTEVTEELPAMFEAEGTTLTQVTNIPDVRELLS